MTEPGVQPTQREEFPEISEDARSDEAGGVSGSRHNRETQENSFSEPEIEDITEHGVSSTHSTPPLTGPFCIVSTSEVGDAASPSDSPESSKQGVEYMVMSRDVDEAVSSSGISEAIEDSKESEYVVTSSEEISKPVSGDISDLSEPPRGPKLISLKQSYMDQDSIPVVELGVIGQAGGSKKSPGDQPDSQSTSKSTSSRRSFVGKETDYEIDAGSDTVYPGTVPGRQDRNDRNNGGQTRNLLTGFQTGSRDSLEQDNGTFTSFETGSGLGGGPGRPGERVVQDPFLGTVVEPLPDDDPPEPPSHLSYLAPPSVRQSYEEVPSSRPGSLYQQDVRPKTAQPKPPPEIKPKSSLKQTRKASSQKREDPKPLNYSLGSPPSRSQEQRYFNLPKGPPPGVREQRDYTPPKDPYLDYSRTERYLPADYPPSRLTSGGQSDYRSRTGTRDPKSIPPASYDYDGPNTYDPAAYYWVWLTPREGYDREGRPSPTKRSPSAPYPYDDGYDDYGDYVYPPYPDDYDDPYLGQKPLLMTGEELMAYRYIMLQRRQEQEPILRRQEQEPILRRQEQEPILRRQEQEQRAYDPYYRPHLEAQPKTQPRTPPRRGPEPLRGYPPSHPPPKGPPKVPPSRKYPPGPYVPIEGKYGNCVYRKGICQVHGRADYHCEDPYYYPSLRTKIKKQNKNTRVYDVADEESESVDSDYSEDHYKFKPPDTKGQAHQSNFASNADKLLGDLKNVKAKLLDEEVVQQRTISNQEDLLEELGEEPSHPSQVSPIQNDSTKADAAIRGKNDGDAAKQHKNVSGEDEDKDLYQEKTQPRKDGVSSHESGGSKQKKKRVTFDDEKDMDTTEVTDDLHAEKHNETSVPDDDEDKDAFQEKDVMHTEVDGAEKLPEDVAVDVDESDKDASQEKDIVTTASGNDKAAAVDPPIEASREESDIAVIRSDEAISKSTAGASSGERDSTPIFHAPDSSSKGGKNKTAPSTAAEPVTVENTEAEQSVGATAFKVEEPPVESHVKNGGGKDVAGGDEAASRAAGGKTKAKKKTKGPEVKELDVQEGRGHLRTIEAIHNNHVTGIVSINKFKCLCYTHFNHNLLHIYSEEQETYDWYQIPGLTNPSGMTSLIGKEHVLAISDFTTDRLHLVTVKMTKDKKLMVDDDAHRIWKLPFKPCDVNLYGNNMLLLPSMGDDSINSFTYHGQQMGSISIERSRIERLYSVCQVGKATFVVADNAENGAILWISSKGEVKERYTGADCGRPLGKPIHVIVDTKGQYLIADQKHNCIHLLDKKGKFKQMLLQRCDGILVPRRLSLDTSQARHRLLVGCGRLSAVEVRVYDYEKLCKSMFDSDFQQLRKQMDIYTTDDPHFEDKDSKDFSSEQTPSSDESARETVGLDKSARGAEGLDKSASGAEGLGKKSAGGAEGLDEPARGAEGFDEPARGSKSLGTQELVTRTAQTQSKRVTTAMVVTSVCGGALLGFFLMRKTS